MKTHWPFGGFFLKLLDEQNGIHEYEDYLKEREGEEQLPEEELEFHCSKDPKKMTMQESMEEMDRFLHWNRMTPEERRAELEAQKAATRATEQAAGDMLCAMEPETPHRTLYWMRRWMLRRAWIVCWVMYRGMHQRALQTRC